MHAPPNIQALRCFVAVAREGAMSRAAARVYLSPSAVSLQVKGLEELLGFALFARTPRGLVLTDRGQALLGDADACLQALDGFTRKASLLAGEARDVLRIGIILDPDFIRLGDLLAAMARAGSPPNVELRHGTSDEALAKVSRRELDAGFYLDSPGNAAPTGPLATDAAGRALAYRSRELTRFRYRVAAPPGWEDRVLGQDWAGLAQLPWLSTPAASAHRRLLATVFGPLGVEPRRTATADQETTALELLAAGAGLGLLREDVARREAKARGLVIADKVGIDCVMSFICLEQDAETPLMARVFSALAEVWPASARP